MALSIYNTLTRTKQAFEPLEPGKVKMYVCGPTVYDYLHVGNFRGPVVYNFVRNYLTSLGLEVTYVYNFTDVDDKILKRAKDENTTSKDIAETYIQAFKDDFSALGLGPHDRNPRVTEHMDDIISLVEKLIEEGKAYAVEGEVFYSVKSFSEYGKLSGRKVEDLQAGVRIEVDPKKKDSMDFALWKPVKSDDTGWNSPWGKGRPGWHIECSAMNHAIFGEQIDIHGGGMDLIFPHHENEIAQIEGVSGKVFAKYWMHNNMFTFGGAKMSKSLGNIRTMHNFLQEYNGEIFKYLTMVVHYRSECDFTENTIKNTVAALSRVYSALALATDYADEAQKNLKHSDIEEITTAINKAQEGITTAINDDFNTPKAFSEIFDVIRLFNQKVKPGQKKKGPTGAIAWHFLNFVVGFGKDMALFQKSPRDFLQQLDEMLIRHKGIDKNQVEELVKQRVQARVDKDFQKADDLRKQLTELGIQVLDTAQGTTWEVDRS